MEAVIDLEADGLNPTKIYCLSTFTKNEKLVTYTDYQEMRDFLGKCTRIICHNGIRFDKPVLERILGIKIKALWIDSLALSWYLQPERPRHGLESYGDDFGVPKPKILDWDNLPLETYIHRCEEDVKINVRLWNEQYKRLIKVYIADESLDKFLKYIEFKMYCAHLQEVSKWKIDLDLVTSTLEELEKEKETKVVTLSEIMPKVPVYVTRTRPKNFIRKDGSLTKKATEWLDLLEKESYPIDIEEIEIITGYNEPNPGSSPQIKSWLFSLGWTPQTFDYPKGKEPVPQVSLKFGKGICPSVKDLFENNPGLEVLEGLSIVSHRISVLKGFLSSQEEGWVKATVQGLTNTLRFQHAKPCVNLPKSDRLYAKHIRQCLTSAPGYILVGSDMTSLEDKIKQHFIFPFDPDYVKSMQEPGYDPHLKVALLAGMLSQEEVDEYKLYVKTDGKEGSKKNSRIRDMAKNGGYALQYGAWPPKIMKTINVSEEIAQKLFDGYWKLNSSIKTVANLQVTKEVDGQSWLQNPVNKFWYTLRNEKDIFSTLVQGTASYVFDLWVAYILKEREQLTAQFHDEIVLCVREDEDVTGIINEAIKKTNEKIEFNVELSVAIQTGNHYGEIH